MSAIVPGSKAFVGLKTETTYGTAVAVPTTDYNRAKSIGVFNKGEQTEGCKNLGLAWSVGQRVYHKKSEGDIVFDGVYQGLEHWFLHLFAGKVTTTHAGSDTGAFTHAFTPDVTRKVGASLEVHASILKMVYPGHKIRRCKLSYRRSSPLEITFGMIGLPHLTPNPPASATASPTFLEDSAGGCIVPIEPGLTGFKLEVGTAGGTSYAASKFTEADIDMDVPHDDGLDEIGDASMAEPVINGQPLMSVSGSITNFFKDNAWILPFLDGSQKALKFTAEAGLCIPGGTKKYSFIVEMPYCRFLQSPPQIGEAGPIRNTIPFIAESPDAVTPPVTLTIINKRSTVA